MDSNRVTISDIAVDLKTTPATVSRALHDHPRISEKTKNRIKKYADKVGFKINKVASSLRSGKTHVIGVMIPSAQINFFGSIVHGIESAASDLGYSVLIFQTNEQTEYEKKGIDTFLSARVDGILASISKQTKAFSHFKKVLDAGIPFAFFDRSTDEIGASSIVIDDKKGAYLATKHLISQGYKNIAHITGPLHIKAFQDRYLGYLQAMNEAGMTIIDDLVFKGDVSIAAGEKAIKYFIKKKLPFDAVYAVEDFTALGAIKALKENNYKLPEDVGIIGFANELLDEHITPTLSSVDQSTVHMGQEAFSLLLEMMDAKTAGINFVPKKIVLDPIPIFRNSTNKKGTTNFQV